MNNKEVRRRAKYLARFVKSRNDAALGFDTQIQTINYEISTAKLPDNGYIRQCKNRIERVKSKQEKYLSDKKEATLELMEIIEKFPQFEGEVRFILGIDLSKEVLS